MHLPNFLVIGAAKGGTTSLHHYLRQHPQVFLPTVKETNFYWAEGAGEGRAIPRTLAEYARYFEPAATQKAVGEISPQYLNSPTAAARIRHDLPAVRLVVSLRSPAERAWSDYLGRTRIGREHRTAEEAVRPGERIFEHGLYYPRLKRYYDLFPRERIHVILHEDYAADTPGTLRTLCAFLGVDPGVTFDTARRHNPAEMPRSNALNRVMWGAITAASLLVPAQWRGTGRLEPLLRRTYKRAPTLPPALARRWRDAYRDDIRATAALIGRDLRHWMD